MRLPELLLAAPSNNKLRNASSKWAPIGSPNMCCESQCRNRVKIHTGLPTALPGWHYHVLRQSSNLCPQCSHLRLVTLFLVPSNAPADVADLRQLLQVSLCPLDHQALQAASGAGLCYRRTRPGFINFRSGFLCSFGGRLKLRFFLCSFGDGLVFYVALGTDFRCSFGVCFGVDLFCAPRAS